VIRSLVGQSRFGAASVETFVSDLQQRLHALSVAHDQLTQSHWKAAPLAALIEAEAKAWTTAEDRRLVLDGPPVMIEARAYQTLALVLHEMMTNAAKYGALSVDDARLAISWALDPERGLILDWMESGGPSVVPPSRRGFGTVVVEQSIPFELKGTARIEHAADGVKAQFTIPTEFVLAGDATAAPRRDLPVARADLQGKNLLLVEDSMMIALDAQAMLQNCGAEVELAATTADARRALSLNTFDAAILDVNLYTETSFAIAEDLQDREIPFVFATGYGETIVVPERFKSVFVVSKPYVEDVLRAALAA
jgi:two-component sensor histidine kinase/CheY-like chemotaxis protein